MAILVLACILLASVFYSLYYGPKKTIEFAEEKVFNGHHLAIKVVLVVPYLVAIPFLMLYYVIIGFQVGSVTLFGMVGNVLTGGD